MGGSFGAFPRLGRAGTSWVVRVMKGVGVRGGYCDVGRGPCNVGRVRSFPRLSGGVSRGDDFLERFVAW